MFSSSSIPEQKVGNLFLATWPQEMTARCRETECPTPISPASRRATASSFAGMSALLIVVSVDRVLCPDDSARCHGRHTITTRTSIECLVTYAVEQGGQLPRTPILRDDDTQCRASSPSRRTSLMSRKQVSKNIVHRYSVFARPVQALDDRRRCAPSFGADPGSDTGCHRSIPPSPAALQSESEFAVQRPRSGAPSGVEPGPGQPAYEPRESDASETRQRTLAESLRPQDSIWRRFVGGYYSSSQLRSRSARRRCRAAGASRPSPDSVAAVGGSLARRPAAPSQSGSRSRIARASR